ncbi:Glyoxalase-like domain protein [Methyloligella halotolerans]|uniref:Bleomycin resistance protein n=1 Tax=Methyloligella halotolerans TaxID=1177755 RepID=A0A1E2S033_9HYPH|nr:glyoxalase superfamily protein [Methyloligella halotolerans]ODA67772.1 Glyoxalase-like domain protein [Methyloligella halotolerans]
MADSVQRPLADPKSMAKRLRAVLAERNVEVSHSEALEVVARQFGLGDWNVLAAQLDDGAGIRFTETCPVLRIFDEDKAKEFYVEFLGFNLDWEHRFGDNFPLYAQVSRAGLTLHLSGHHGDGTPGSGVFVRMQGVRQFQAELIAKNYRHMKPGLEGAPWGLVTSVTDPFNNRIHFCEAEAE